jgi:hypothetical protein
MECNIISWRVSETPTFAADGKAEIRVVSRLG